MNNFFDDLCLRMRASFKGSIIDCSFLILAKLWDAQFHHVDIIYMVCCLFIIVMSSCQKVGELKICVIRVSKSAQSKIVKT